MSRMRKRKKPVVKMIRLNKKEYYFTVEEFRKLEYKGTYSFALEALDYDDQEIYREGGELAPTSSDEDKAKALKLLAKMNIVAKKKEEAEHARYLAEEKVRAKAKADKRLAFFKEHPLPDGITNADLDSPDDYKQRVDFKYGGQDYELKDHVALWYTSGFGWVLKTLFISQSRKQTTERSYGVVVDTKELVSIGGGPHVLGQFEVYLTKSNRKRIEPYFQLYKEGLQKASSYRDRLSSRRLNASRRRAYY